MPSRQELGTVTPACSRHSRTLRSGGTRTTTPERAHVTSKPTSPPTGDSDLRLETFHLQRTVGPGPHVRLHSAEESFGAAAVDRGALDRGPDRTAQVDQAHLVLGQHLDVVSIGRE